MTNIDLIEKHITKDVPIKLMNSDDVEDTFYFKPMKFKEQLVATDIFKTLNKLQEKYKNKDKNSEIDLKISDKLDTELMQKTFDLFMSITKRSFEGITDEMAENFVQTNFDQLFKNIGELLPKTKAVEESKKIKERREMVSEKK